MTQKKQPPFVILKLAGTTRGGHRTWVQIGTAETVEAAQDAIATFPKGEVTFAKRADLLKNSSQVDQSKGTTT